jgi:hypothetical protein
LRGLKHSSFFLSDESDSIIWSWYNSEGNVSAKQAYEVQFLDDIGDG